MADPVQTAVRAAAQLRQRLRQGDETVAALDLVIADVEVERARLLATAAVHRDVEDRRERRQADIERRREEQRVQERARWQRQLDAGELTQWVAAHVSEFGRVPNMAPELAAFLTDAGVLPWQGSTGDLREAYAR